MAQIIITACDEKTSREFDVEVPNDLEVGKLADDLIQALMGADPMLQWDFEQVRLYSAKLNMELDQSHTLKEQGVWNGDYVRIREI